MNLNNLRKWMYNNNIPLIENVKNNNLDNLTSELDYYFWLLNNKSETIKEDDFCNFLFNNMIKKYGGFKSKKTIQVFNIFLNLLKINIIDINNIKLSYFMIIFNINPLVKQLNKINVLKKKFEKFFKFKNLFLENKLVFHDELIIFINTNYNEYDYSILLNIIESYEIIKFNKKCLNINKFFEIILKYIFKINIENNLNNNFEKKYIDINEKIDNKNYVINNMKNMGENIYFQREVKKEYFYKKKKDFNTKNKSFNLNYLKYRKYRENEFINKRILEGKNTKSDVYFGESILKDIPYILKVYKKFKLNV